MDLKKSSITADILHVLNDGKIHTLQEIADEVEAHKSTIKRHIQSLSYRYPIETFHGGDKKGGVYLDKSAIHQGKILTRDELILDKEIILKLRELAKDVFNALEGNMYMRVDFLLSKDGTIYLNEVNTIPGLTRTSHFIVLAKEIGFDNLFKLLINNALISYKRKNHGKSPILSC